MSECGCLQNCIFFLGQMANMPVAAETARQRYCQGNYYTRCARYTVYRTLGRGQVPADLFPTELATAHQIIARAIVGIS